MNRKVLIIGLDGGTWEIFNPLILKGLMPTLKKMASDGIRGTLKSTIPPITPAAWASFQTGVNPGKHGVFSFSGYDPKNNCIKIVNSKSLKVQTIWEYVSQQGKKVVSINVPLTYPPKRINGCMISGLLTPSIESNFTYPKRLREEILHNVGHYQLPETGSNYRPFQDFRGTINYLIDMVKNRTAVALYLLNRCQWDLFMVHFQATDFLQHPFWGYMKEGHALFDREKADYIEKFYRLLDRCLAKITENQNEETIIILMSDHGFQSANKIFYLNTWLYKNNLFFPRESHLSEKVINSATSIVRRIDRHVSIRRFSILNKLEQKVSSTSNQNRLHFDSSKSIAYAGIAGGFGAIHLNCSNNKRERVKSFLINALTKIEDPETGNKVIDTVFRKEDIYKGNEIDAAPDLILKPTEGYMIPAREFKKRKIFRKTQIGKDLHIGTHHEDGIFLFYGNGIKKNYFLKEASIMDLFPTILHALRLPIPDHIDGKVLLDLEVFDDEFD